MKRSREKPLDAAELRRRAEKRLKASKKQEVRPGTKEETRRLLHELQVHQIELEMQNEELQQARAETEAVVGQYTDLYDFAPVGYVTLDRDGTIRQANLTGARLLGVERSRLMNRRFGLFVSEDSRPAFNAFLQKVFEGQATKTCEVALRKEGNQPIWAHIEATVSEDGQECRAAVVDITERKRAEEALRESSAFNAMLLQTMPVGMDIVDEQGHVLFLSPAMERAMGKQAIGELCWHLYKDDQQQCADCPLKQQISVGKTQSLESAGVLGGKTVEISHTGMIYRGKKALLEVFYDITERKQMEGALQEAEQKYRGIFENAVEGIFQSTPDGRFLTANPVFARMFGYQTPEELVSTITDIPTQLYVNPEDRQSFQQLLEKFGFVEAFETELYHKDGRKIWISINTRAVKDENGTVRYYEGMVEEITARKQAEEKLQARYNELQSLNKIGYIILTASDFKSALARVLSEILPACSLDLGVFRLLDAKSQNLEPIASLGFNDLEDENMLRSAYLERGRDPTVDHVLTEKKTVVLENLRELGALHIMQREGIQSAILLPIKTEQQILGILQVGNRTTRRFQPDEVRLLEGAGNLIGIGVQKAQLYEETRRNLERIRALHEIDKAITSTLDLRAVLDVLLEKIALFLPYPTAVTVRLMNQETGVLESLASRGMDEEEWKMKDSRSVGGRARKIVETKAPLTIRNVQTDPQTHNPEIFRKHGLVSHLGVPLIVKGKAIGVLGLYTKEEHEFSNEEIEFLSTLAGQTALAINNAQLYEGMAKANKVKDEFLSIMSHEMRTPLNVVVGYSGMIMDGMLGEVNEKQKEAMGKIIRLANDQLVMINNVLYATVLETEKTRVESHELSLGDFLAQLKSGYEAPINKELVFNWDYPANLPLIRTDSAKLKQILQNLIDNAIKFTDKGSVTVSARITEGSKQKAEATENRQEEGDSTHASRLPPHAFVEFKVADTGAGIPKEALPMIFDKFKQADSSETRVYGGVGMGLYIVKKFAELLGGQVEVESEAGKGSTFTVTLSCGQ